MSLSSALVYAFSDVVAISWALARFEVGTEPVSSIDGAVVAKTIVSDAFFESDLLPSGVIKLGGRRILGGMRTLCCFSLPKTLVACP